MTTNATKYLLVKGKAGLGNRILVLLDSILLAEISGRQLLVDWRDGKYGADGENAFPALFDCPTAGDVAAIEGCDSVTPATWRNHLGESVDALFARAFPHDPEMDTVARVAAKYTVDLSAPDDGASVAVRWGWTHELSLLRSRFTGPHEQYKAMATDAILRLMMRDRVRLVPALRAQVDDFSSRHFAKKAIGVHVRYSDRKNAYDVCFKHVQAFLKQHPDAVVFLATDNQVVEADFKARFPRVAVTVKWFPPAGVPIHRNDLPERRPLENAKEALIDLYLLGECDALIFNSTSTFSILAKLLSHAPAGSLIDTAPLSIKPLMRRGLRTMRSMKASITSAIGLGG